MAENKKNIDIDLLDELDFDESAASDQLKEANKNLPKNWSLYPPSATAQEDKK